MAGVRPSNDETEQLMKQLVKALEENQKKAQRNDREFGSVSNEVERLQQNLTANRGKNTAHTYFRRNVLQNEKEMLEKERQLFRNHIEQINADMNAGMAKSAEDYRRELAKYVDLRSYQSMQQAAPQQPIQSNNTQSNTGTNAGKVAVGAGGVIWGAGRGVKNFVKSLGSKKDEGGYKDPNSKNWVNLLFFLFFFFIIATQEMIGGGYLDPSSPLRWGYTIIFFLWIIFALREERNAAFMVLAYTLVVPMIFGIFGSMPFISEIITNAVAYHTFVLFAFPAILYFMIFSEETRLPGKQVWRFVIVATILILGLAFTDAAEIQNRLQATGGDTGFSFEKAMQGLSGAFQGFGTGFLEPVVCALNPNCGFQNWLTTLTEPFAYDSTTVHDIQNRDLGIYIVDASIPRAVDVTGLNFQFLPEPIGFYIRAPLPDKLAIEICQIGNRLKGFDEVCDKDVIVACVVEDAGGTSVRPHESISIGDALLSSNTLYQCRVSNPRLGTKRVNLSVNYPFVTNTYKYIRAVNASQVLTSQTYNELNKMPPKTIISTGGPVILESDESSYISVRQGNETVTNLLIRLRAQNNVRLTSVDNIEIYLPEGMELEQSTDSLCSFTKIPTTEREAKDAYDNCIDKAIEELSTAQDNRLISNLATECESFNVERGAVLACRLLDTCEAIKERNAFEKNVTHLNAYEMTPLAIQSINTILEGPAKQKTGNDIVIGCEIRINADKFLFENPLRGVTERALNIVSYYRAEHQVTGSIRFSGTQIPVSTVSHGDIGNKICNDRSSGLSIPIGFLPMKANSPPLLTLEFGSTSDPLKRGSSSYVHRGIDISSSGGGMIISAWDGVVFRAVSNCDKCKGYGNYVVIESKDNKGNIFYHLYAHLGKVAVNTGETVTAGKELGTQGNTGSSTGPHLHFEVRVGSYTSGKLMNPLACINHEALSKEGIYSEAIRVAQTGVTYSYPAVPRWDDFPTAQNVDKFIEGLIEKEGENGARVQFAKKIVAESSRQGVKPEIMLAIAMQESNLNHYNARGEIQLSSGNAVGLMQVVPKTAASDCSDFSEFKPYQHTLSSSQRAEITRRLGNIDTNVKCGVEVYKKKPAACNPTVQKCDCTITRKIDGKTIILDDYSNTYYGKIQAYKGWACTPHPEYTESVYLHLRSILGPYTTPLPPFNSADSTTGSDITTG